MERNEKAMQYLTELHAHTNEVSPCADLPASEVAERYIAAGYSTVMVTNHYTKGYFADRTEPWEKQADAFVSGYRAMKEYVGDRLNVLLGCELRFAENNNDYLIIGVTEEFLREYPRLDQLSLRTFSPLARENGMLVVQAHPFRNGMVVMDPSLLDGMEAFNGHRGHQSRNDIANAWAMRHHLIRTSGTDFHHPHQTPLAGIYTDEPIADMQTLLSVLKSGDYTIHCGGEVAERDGMTDMPAIPR